MIEAPQDVFNAQHRVGCYDLKWPRASLQGESRLDWQDAIQFLGAIQTFDAYQDIQARLLQVRKRDGLALQAAA